MAVNYGFMTRQFAWKRNREIENYLKKKSLFYVFTFHCKILGQKWRLRVYEGPKTGAKNTACADF